MSLMSLYLIYMAFLKKKKRLLKGRTMAEFKYEIMQELGILSEAKSGWTRELNLISWNGADPKFDIRDWAPGHEKMGKGISLNADEIEKLRLILERAL